MELQRRRLKVISLFHDYIAEILGETVASGDAAPDGDDAEQRMVLLEALLVRRGLVAAATRREETAKLLTAFDQNLFAVEHYLIEPAEQAVVLFSATSTDNRGFLDQEWSRYTLGHVTCHPIHADHYSMLKGTGAVEIAARLSELMP